MKKILEKLKKKEDLNFEESKSVFENIMSGQAKDDHIYDFLNMPKDPFKEYLVRAGKLTKRPWRLIHSDIHRANMIEQENGRLVIIDWELALYGDVLYCIASHLHRSRFFPHEKEIISKRIYEHLPEEFQKNYMKDLSFYMDFEALNSVVSDTVRFPDLFRKNVLPRSILEELSVYYADNLNRISDLLGTRKTTPEKAMIWFEEWQI